MGHQAAQEGSRLRNWGRVSDQKALRRWVGETGRERRDSIGDGRGGGEEVGVDDFGAHGVEVGVVPGEDDFQGGRVVLADEGELPVRLWDGEVGEVVVELGAKGFLHGAFEVVRGCGMEPLNVLRQVETW